MQGKHLKDISNVWDVVDLEGASFLALQELGGLGQIENWAPFEVTLGQQNFTFFGATPQDAFRGVGVGIPTTKASQVRKVHALSAGLAVQTQNAGAKEFVISLHLPHSQRPDAMEVTQRSCLELEQLLQCARLQDSVFLCMDANYELSELVPQESDARGPILHTFLRQHGLDLTTPHEHTWSNSRGASSRIDFVAYRTPRLTCLGQAVHVDTDKTLECDHRAVSVTVRGMPSQRTRRGRPRHKCGQWRVDPTKALDSCNKLATGIELNDEPLTPNMLETAASSSCQRAVSCRYQDSTEIKGLIRERKRVFGRERRDLSKQIAQQRAAARKEWLQHLLNLGAGGDYRAISYFRRRESVAHTHASFVIRMGGIDSALKAMKSFYHAKYTPRELTPPSLPMAMYLSAVPHVPAPQPIQEEEILHVLSTCKRGKSAGQDGITYEFIETLMQSNLSGAFVAWFNSILAGSSDIPEPWRISQATFLPKRQEPSCPSDLRPIVLSSTPAKIFTKILLIRMRTVFGPTRAGQIGCIPGRQTADGACAVQQAIRLSNQWHLPLVVVKLDITQAFDHVDHRAISRYLATLGPSREAFRLLSLIVRSSICLNIAGREWTQELRRGVVQGSSYSAELFARLLDHFLSGTYDNWRSQEDTWLRGQTDFEKLFMVIFADDIILLATSFAQMQRLVRDVQDTLECIGLSLAISKANVISSPWIPPEPVFLKGSDTPVQAVQAMLYLGVLIGFQVTCMQVLQARLVRATNAFHAFYKILVRKVGSIKTRLNLLTSYVASKWHWLSPCVRPTTQILKTLDVLQCTFMMFIISPAYDSFQSVTANFVIRRRAVKMMAQALDHTRWSSRLATAFFGYWGHAARRIHELGLPVSTALKVRDEGWTWTHPEERRALGFWPDASRFLQLMWRDVRPRHGPVCWTEGAQDRGLWTACTQEWLSTKGWHPTQTHADLHSVDLGGRMVVRIPTTPADAPHSSRRTVPQQLPRDRQGR